MRTRIIALVLALLAGESLAYAQAPDIVPDDAATAGKAALLPRRRSLDPAPATAEDAEGIVRPAPRVWARSEYMIWRIKAATFPTLITSGDFADAAPGAVSSAGSTVLLGGAGMDFRDRQGGRFSAGYWLDDEHTWGMEASYFFLTGRSVDRNADSPGSPVLAVPFFNTNTGMQDASLVSYPGVMSGQVAVDAPSFLHGTDANLARALWVAPWFRLEALGGFRYLNLNEGLHLTQTSQVALAPQYVGLIPFDGNTITVSDRFDVRNHFYGGQLGARAELHNDRWSLSVLAKVALGVTHQSVKIRGFTGIDTQPAVAQDAGLFAVASNRGQFSRNAFAVVPEVGVNLGFRLTERIQVFAGYSFLYWSDVARPADQVDSNVNPNFVPTSMTFGAVGGANRPTVPLHGTSFFAHGANFGLEFRY